MKIKLVHKHLPGEHDQQSHTPKKYGTGEVPTPKQQADRDFRILRDRAKTYVQQLWDGKIIPKNLKDGKGLPEHPTLPELGNGRMTAEEMIDTAYNFHDPDSGLTSKVYKIQFNPYMDGLAIEGIIYNEAGTTVGSFTRYLHIDSKDMHNTYFKLDDNQQQKGFGSKFYRNSEEALIYQGIKRISIKASLNVGGYAWAKMGFDFYDKRDREEFIGEAKKAWGSKYPGVRQPAFETLWDVASAAGPGDTLGKEFGRTFLLGKSWKGVKRLNPFDARNDGVINAQVYYDKKDSKK